MERYPQFEMMDLERAYGPQIDKGRAHGNKNAAPVFRRIVDQVLQEMKIPPDRRVE